MANNSRIKDSMSPVRKESSLSRPTTLHEFPDKLLELILVCLSSPLWLIQAAATCKRWRRIVLQARFLSSVTNRQAIVGYYHNRTAHVDGGHGLAFVPSSSPKVAVTGRHFSLDFLPEGGARSWEIVDSRHSLLLLAKRKPGWRRHRLLPELLVCEPVTRRYKQIPSMEDQHLKYHRCIGVFLHDCGRRGHTTWSGRIMDTMSRLTVVCVLYHEYAGLSGNVGTARAFMFERGWRGEIGWYEKKQAPYKPKIHLQGKQPLSFLGSAGGSLFWAIQGDSSSWLAFNFRSVNEFAFVPLPDHIRGLPVRVIDSQDFYGMVRAVCLQGNNLRIFSTTRYGSHDWELQKSLQLMEATRGLPGYKEEYFRITPKIVTASMRSIVLASEENAWRFSVDLETMEVVKCEKHSDCYADASMSYPYELPWLPVMHACMVRCTRWGRGRCSNICVC